MISLHLLRKGYCRMLLKLLMCIAFLNGPLSLLNGHAQGLPLIRNYTAAEYGGHNRNYDIDVVGKWPEEAIGDIKKFLEESDYCRDVAKDVAAILTEKDYHLNVLKEKTYDSTKDLMKGRGKRK